MVRAPCCDKVGLKKGPWTTEEDQILMSFIHKYGHENWRALPKQAGLLRCGKSCRLRWINYLRPDIKRGNFSTEEEETIMKLHEMLGNKWSAIAAKLPGRTDNEIKNVWHTHLKKRLKRNQANPEIILPTPTNHFNALSKSPSSSCLDLPSHDQEFETDPSYTSLSPQTSSSDFSSVTDASLTTMDPNNQYMMDHIEVEDMSESFPVIDDSLWSESPLPENTSVPSDLFAISDHDKSQTSQYLFNSIEVVEPLGYDHFGSIIDDGMEFWYNLFITAGGSPESSEF